MDWIRFWGSLDWLHPEYLLLAPISLLILFVLEWRAKGRRDVVKLGRVRTWLLFFTRSTLILLLVFALAGLCIARSDNTVSVLFCLDRSASMERAKQEWALDWIRQAMSEMEPDDRAGVLVFGSDSNIEVPLQTRPELLEPRALVDKEFTNLAGVLRLAQAHFSGANQRKIVILSDGRENLGGVLKEGAVARSNGIPIVTVHCETAPAEGEVLVESILVPERVDKGEPFSARVTIVSGMEQEGTLHFQKGENHTETRSLKLKPGRNIVELPQRLDRADVHVFKVSVDAKNDENPINNVSWALTEVLGKSRVLLIDREPEKIRLLEGFLKQAGFEVFLGGPALLPIRREELARYDAVILSDVPATAFSREQLTLLESYVKDLGGGLAMLGGEESFGLGGYFGTGVEKVLPVECDIRNKENLPSLGLVFVIDRSGSMSAGAGGFNNLELAKEGARRTLDLLYKKDKVGIIGFDSSYSWVLPLAVQQSRLETEKALSGLIPGGGTNIYPGFDAASKALATSGTDLKHLVILTDGRSADGDYESVIVDCQRNKVSISTIGIGDSVDKSLLQWIAERGKGRFFLAEDASELPRIFTKDTLTASRSLLVEKSFVPQSLLPSELNDDDSQWPPLHGFVLTSARDEAELLVSSTKGKEGKTDGPILARWRVGLGKSLAFTSSIKGDWGKDWRNWEGLGQFWARATEWLCKDRGDPSVSLDLRWDRGQGKVVVDMPERQDDFLDLRARVVPPPGGPKIPPVKLTQVGPGRYEGAFSAPRAGVYLVTAGLQEGKRERPLATRGVVMSYPREYKDLKSNPQLLSRLASLTGGKAYSLKETPRGIFERSGESSQSSQEVWPWLLFFASILFVFDIALRRLDFSGISHRIQEARKAKVDDEQVFEQLMTRKTVLKEKLSVHSQKREELRRSASSRTMKATETVTVAKSAERPAKPDLKDRKASARAPKSPESGRGKPRPSSRRQSMAEEVDYTSRLLAAKKRARDKG